MIDTTISDELTAPDVRLDDKQRHYLITPPGADAPMPYLRATSFISVVGEESHLDRWRRRLMLETFAANPDETAGRVRTAESDYDSSSKSKALDALARDLHTEAGGDEKRDYGTELHEALRCWVIDIPYVEVWPGRFDGVATDLAGAIGCLESHDIIIDPAFCEVALACHALKVAGRTDGITTPGPHGRRIIDLKSGSLDLAKCAMQLAVYANADHVVTNDGRTLTPLPDDLDRKVGYILHAPKGKGKATLWQVDLAAGWDDVQVAVGVHRIQSLRQADRGSRVIAPAEPAPLVVAEDRQTYLLERIENVKATGDDAKALLAQRWPGGVATPKKLGDSRWDDADLAAIEAAVSEVEQAHAVTFPESLPPGTEVHKRELSPEPSPPPDEGPDMDPADVDALKARLGRLEPVERTWALDVVRACRVAGRPVTLSDVPSRRRYAIVRALMLLARIDPSDELLRALCGVVMGADDQPGFALGMVVGSLNIDEAERLGRLIEALGDSVNVAYGTDGVRLVGDLAAHAA